MDQGRQDGPELGAYRGVGGLRASGAVVAVITGAGGHSARPGEPADTCSLVRRERSAGPLEDEGCVPGRWNWQRVAELAQVRGIDTLAVGHNLGVEKRG